MDEPVKAPLRAEFVAERVDRIEVVARSIGEVAEIGIRGKLRKDS